MPSRDDDLLDFGSPFVDPERTDLTVERLDNHSVDYAKTTEQLYGLVDDLLFQAAGGLVHHREHEPPLDRFGVEF